MRLLAIPVVLATLLACDGTTTKGGASQLQTSTPTITLGTTWIPRSSEATQVGSEGFWGCVVDSVVAIPDGTVVIDALGGAPVDLVAERIADWPLEIVDTDATGSIPGSLDVVDLSAYDWVTVEGTGCTDHLVAGVAADLTRDTTEPIAMSGLLAIRVDTARLLLTDDEDIDTVAAVWGATDGNPNLRLDADLDPADLAGDVSYAGCRTPAPCGTALDLATITSSR